MADRDQSLAAEPSFHGGPPGGGKGAVISIHHVFDSPPKLVVEQSENVQPLSSIPAQATRWFMEASERGAAFERAPGTVMEFL